MILLALWILPGFRGAASADPGEATVFIWLSRDDASASRGEIRAHGQVVRRFPVGSGTRGIRAEGERFAGGWSLLGRFRVQMILGPGRAELDGDLVARAGRSLEDLREKLFANMNSIDFDGDGQAGEYGAGYVGLRPLAGGDEPFHFGTYRGVFRWYGYAIHGTADAGKVGKRSTGGCINLLESDLLAVLSAVELGDLVEVREVR